MGSSNTALSQRRLTLWSVLPLGVFFIAYYQLTSLGWTGVDAPTWVFASDGRTWEGWRWALLERHFVGYRPLTAVSYSLGSLIHGLDPLGYQLTDGALFLGLVYAVYFLIQTLGFKARCASLSASLLCLHPLTMEVVPVLARRGDLLSTLASVLALRAFLKGQTRRTVVLAFAAIASKETAFALLPVLGASLLILPKEERRVGLWGLAGIAGAVLVFLGLRFIALDGELLGGYPKIRDVSSWSIMVDAWAGLAVPYPGSLVSSIEAGAELSKGGIVLGVIGLLAFTVLAIFGSSRSPRLFWLAFVWWGSQTALFVVTKKWELRLLFPCLPAVALWVAAWIGAQGGRWRTILCLGVGTFWAVQGPLTQGVGEWREASRLQTQLLEDTVRALENHPDTEVLLVANYPLGVWSDSGLRRITLLKPRTELRDFTSVFSPSGLHLVLQHRFPDASFERLFAVNNLILFEEGVEVSVRAVARDGNVLLTQEKGAYLSTMDAALSPEQRPGAPNATVSLDYHRPQRALLVVFGEDEASTFPLSKSLRILFTD